MDDPIQHPSFSYSGFIHGGFGGGRTVHVQGRISPSASRFAINIQCGSSSEDSDIALHFNPRFDENVIVRNTKRDSSWEREERHGGFPLMKGQNFDIIIISEAQRYMIAINGQHFTEFDHRMPSNRVNHLRIHGDISASLIQFEEATAPNLSAPIVATSAPCPSSNANPVGLVAPRSSHYPSAAPGHPMAGLGFPLAGAIPAGPPPPAYGSPYPRSGYPPPSWYGHGHGICHGICHGGDGGLRGVQGPAAAGVGGPVSRKAHKKGKKNKLLKYGLLLQLAGVGVGGRDLSKAMKHAHEVLGHIGHDNSNSSSSSSSDSD